MRKLSSFSVILVFIVLMIIGAGMIPLLNIQYTPTAKTKTLRISYSWSGASARVIESEVTSRLEGLISSIYGVTSISSLSQQEHGSIEVSLKPNSNNDAIRFEIASLIRQTYSKLPHGVSYPQISTNSARDQAETILTYTLNGNMPTSKINKYAEDNILKDLAMIDGVNDVSLYGATENYLEISADPAKLRSYGISFHELADAINSSLSTDQVVGSINNSTIILSSSSKKSKLELAPIKNINDKIVRLQDVANIVLKEQLPRFYYRINGLNTINIAISAEKSVNTLEVIKKIKEKMAELERAFPPNFSAIISYDSSEFLKKEINKILWRTISCIFILLMFVLITSRSLRYLAIITITLIANILIAFIFYYIYKLEIHLYSLAGITVSLGIIIDTSIIMISHYGYYKNRKAFLSIFAAAMTTIGALAVVFLLPERQQMNLIDFSAVIIINISISMVIALLFVPALIDKLTIRGISATSSLNHRRKILKFNQAYSKYISFGREHRWIFVLLLIFGFGLPIHLLPPKIEPKKGKEPDMWMDMYNKTIGSRFYQERAKKPLEKIIGGSFRLFQKNMQGKNFYREPKRPTLTVYASLPEGCTIQQLNEIMLYMENYLTRFKEIEIFKTSINSYQRGSINISFKKEYENSAVPKTIKQEIIAKAIAFGGATWSVYGIDDQYFSNQMYSGYKSNRIEVTGYNYDQLFAFCQESVSNLSKNQRVSEAGIFGNVELGNTLSRTEYFIDYNSYNMASLGVTMRDSYFALQEWLYSTPIASYFNGTELIPVNLVSSEKENFTVWNLQNEHIDIGDKSVRFSNIGSVEKRQTGNDIFKKDQQYVLYVAYDFIGSSELASRVLKKEVERLNSSVLPIGFKATSNEFGWWGKDKGMSALLIILVIGIIYFTCSVLLESLRQPLIIISLIPISFIGVFLTFYITGYLFDQGGFASLVMLSGISVNAGIYIINQYNLQKRYGKNQTRTTLQHYIRAYNHKIVPIMLTILSTTLGLIPFLFEGQNDVFWFAFAVGTMGGMIFSIIALLFFMPIWTKG